VPSSAVYVGWTDLHYYSNNVALAILGRRGKHILQADRRLLALGVYFWRFRCFYFIFICLSFGRPYRTLWILGLRIGFAGGVIWVEQSSKTYLSGSGWYASGRERLYVFVFREPSNDGCKEKIILGWLGIGSDGRIGEHLFFFLKKTFTHGLTRQDEI